MVNVVVNGEPKALRSEALPDALRELGYTGKHFAVAIDGVFVPRGRYDEVRLRDGVRLEALSPIQGG